MTSSSTNNHSHALQLPAELLEKIFLQITETSRTRGVESPCGTLALVCTFWRNVIYGSKQAWSRIYLARIGEAERHLERARGVPLHVTWSAISQTASFPSTLFLEHAAMVESLSFCDDGDNLRYLDHIDFPILRKFACMTDGINPQVFGAVAPPRMPCLESVVFQ